MSDALLLGCPSCHAMNRVRQARLGDSPVCGKCRQPLFRGEPVDVTAANYESLVARSELPVVVDFWANWCGPCKMMAPVFAQMANELEPRMRFAKLDTEAEPSLAGRFSIRSIPTLIVFKDGKEIARQPGAMQGPQLRQWLEPHLVTSSQH
ncbi:thioredoxin TrxC [Litchfieldella xinjiangensis]|uniref:thioredoxin TrxC n=1 Tax=Litchfieldella xinjiangensis TaxID=1166948 RepID=UPI0005BBCF6F|nr:thioredoxin TrxC [Halomonas xinjiangensis]